MPKLQPWVVIAARSARASDLSSFEGVLNGHILKLSKILKSQRNMEILELKSPLEVEITLTESCNHRCIHCYNPWREKSIGYRSLSYEQIDFICNELQKCEVYSVVITGGEPTSKYDLLLYLIEKLRQCNIDYSLNSNITLLTLDQILELKSKGISHILTSLPSIYEDKFEHITQKKGSYSIFLKNLSLINIDITANMVITRKNVKELDEIANFVKAYKIKGLTLSLVIPPKYNPDDKTYMLDNESVIKIADTLLYLKKEMGIYVNSLTPLPLCVLKDVDKYQSLVTTSCCAGIAICTIGADGNVQACAHDTKNYGNIFQEGLSKCWERMVDWRKAEHLNAECKECDYIGLCGGECRMLSTVHSNDKYTINKNAPIIFNPKEVPTLDLNSKYIINSNAIMREEPFGASLIVCYKHIFVTKNIVALFNIMKRLGSFKIADLLNYVEYNDNFNSTIYYMEQIGLIIKEQINAIEKKAE